jgi:hypothetical protein
MAKRFLTIWVCVVGLLCPSACGPAGSGDETGPQRGERMSSSATSASPAGDGRPVLTQNSGTDEVAHECIPPWCERAWVDGRQVETKFGPYTGDPLDPHLVKDRLYIVGAQDLDHPQDQRSLVAMSPGVDHVVRGIPGHGDEVHRMHIVVVQMAPGASDRVRVRTDSIGGVGDVVALPYQIDLGLGFVPITSYSVIEEGMERGLLGIYDLGVGCELRFTQGTLRSPPNPLTSFQ